MASPVTIARTTAMTPTETPTETTPAINHSIDSCMAPPNRVLHPRYVVIAAALTNPGFVYHLVRALQPVCSTLARAKV